MAWTLKVSAPSATWASRLSFVALAAVIVIAALSAWLGRSNMNGGTSGSAKITRSRIPVAPPLLLKDVDPATAMAINRALPFSREPNPPPAAFKANGNDLAYVRALQCLTSAIYYEAASEGLEGRRAVAQVVLNRVRHPAFPKSICDVVFEGARRKTGCQFSFTCDGALLRKPNPVIWAQARAVAAAAIEGSVFAPVGYATHYHANYVVPYWASSLAKNALVGTHIFYRWPGWWGQPAAFRGKHSGREPDPRILRHLALRLSGKPLLDDPLVEVDPRVELLSIIDLVAGPPREEDDMTTYEKDVRERFSSYKNHVAVEIYRQLKASGRSFDLAPAISSAMQYSAPPLLNARGAIDPKIIEAAGGREPFDGFIAAIRDFSVHSKFEAFFAEKRAFYAERSMAGRTVVLEALAKIERREGQPVTNVRFFLAPVLQDITTSGCRRAEANTSERWMLVPIDDAGKPNLMVAKVAATAEELAAGDCKALKARPVLPPSPNRNHNRRGEQGQLQRL